MTGAANTRNNPMTDMVERVRRERDEYWLILENRRLANID